MTLALLAGLLLASFLYRRFRNVRIARPPVLYENGVPVPEIRVRLANGEQVGVIDAGSRDGAATLLLIPGADGVRQTWRHQVGVLSRRWRVVAPDLRSRIEPTDSLDTLVDDVIAVCEATAAGRVIAVGQSLGGPVAMRLVTRRPDLVRGVAIVNSLARLSYSHVGLNPTLFVPVAMATTRYLPTPLARAFARLWSRWSVWVFDSSPGWQRVVDYVLWTGPRTVPPSVGKRRVRLLRGEDLRPELAQFDLAALVVKGPLDTYVPVEWSKDIAARIHGAEYVEVPGTGHCTHISMPVEFNRLLMDWIGRVGEPGGDKEVAE